MVSDLDFPRIPSGMPKKLVEEYRGFYNAAHTQQISYEEAELEAAQFLRGVLYLQKLRAKSLQKEREHRYLTLILTSGFKEPKLGPVDSEFFGDANEKADETEF